MKTILAVLLLSSQVFAVSNPLIRNCQLAGGQFLIFQTSDNDVATCHIQQSFIGALDLFLHVSQEQSWQSIIDYQSSIHFCQGQEVELSTSEGYQQKFCFYDDGSLIDLVTLQKGRYSSEQKAFNQALGL